MRYWTQYALVTNEAHWKQKEDHDMCELDTVAAGPVGEHQVQISVLDVAFNEYEQNKRGHTTLIKSLRLEQILKLRYD